ncbi:ectonucleoside triphosphate diphosphohydrolase 5-like [Plakobranchus ocellatus]|uniref:Ectonucleoside triphosphate diphosphohydrolase 5-like n=1 Tax=Plakobranchus ocellatus TaxID=259542 RepID=A0AAV3ZR31_9GAST|nr:ectonucleoside triphosphate diphosphohydrolase 5-like [Plakobranchus ocellatus]
MVGSGKTGQAKSGLPPPPGQEESVNPYYERQWRLRMIAHFVIMVVLSALLVRYSPVLGIWSTSSAQDLFSVVIDAGSTGSRVFVYHFKAISGDFHNHEGVRLESEYFQSVEPGISSYSKHPQQAANSLKPMLKRSLKHVPQELHDQTLVILKATAGLRLLPAHKAEAILSKVRQLLVSSPYYLPDPGKVMIMSGEEEGLFGWITVNFLLDVLWDDDDDNTVTAFDLGGGSVQVTFELLQEQLDDCPVKDLYRVKLMHKSFNVFTHSYLGYGLKSARFSILGGKEDPSSDDPYDDTRSHLLKDGLVAMDSDCFPEGVRIDFTHGETNFTVRGANVNANILPTVETKVRDFVAAEGFIQSPALESRDLHLFSYFFDVARWARLIPWNEHHYQLTPASYYAAAKSYCLQKNFPEKRPFLCMDLIYIYVMLTQGVGLPPDKPLIVETKLLGREVSWSLGAALSTLSEDFFFEQISLLQ